MTKKKETDFQSTFRLENCSSTLANHDQIKVQIETNRESIKEKKYNPYEHRDLQHPNTFSGALIHLLKSSLGTGILAIPRAFKTAGMGVGGIGTILIGYLCAHSIQILVSASQDMCVRIKKPSLGYPETTEEIFKHGPKSVRKFANSMRTLVEIAFLLTHSVGNAVYIVFISESTTKLAAYYHPEAADWSQYVKLVILLPLILCCQVRNLKHMVPFSFIANVTMILALAITLYYMFVDIHKVDIKDRNVATSLTNLPSFFSTVVFAMEGIGTVMPVENSMTKPQFLGCPGVLNFAMTIVIALYSCMGFFGYLVFGENTEATITQNLPSDKIPAQIVQATISLAVFFTFMLQFYVPMDIIWTRIKNKIPEEKHNITQILMRTIGVLVIVTVAAAAGHHLDALIDLVGALFLATLGLAFPPLFDIIAKWKNWGRCNWILFKDILMICFGIFGIVSGTYQALQSFFK